MFYGYTLGLNQKNCTSLKEWKLIRGSIKTTFHGWQMRINYRKWLWIGKCEIIKYFIHFHSFQCYACGSKIQKGKILNEGTKRQNFKRRHKCKENIYHRLYKQLFPHKSTRHQFYKVNIRCNILMKGFMLNYIYVHILFSFSRSWRRQL